MRETEAVVPEISASSKSDRDRDGVGDKDDDAGLVGGGKPGGPTRTAVPLDECGSGAGIRLAGEGGMTEFTQ